MVGKKPFEVIRQYPETGVNVKSGRVVYVSVTKEVADKIPLSRLPILRDIVVFSDALYVMPKSVTTLVKNCVSSDEMSLKSDCLNFVGPKTVLLRLKPNLSTM